MKYKWAGNRLVTVRLVRMFWSIENRFWSKNNKNNNFI